MERWVAIQGGYYSVSSLGRVRRERTATNTSAGRLLIPYQVGRGYLCVRLCRSGSQSQSYVHRLVAEAFLGRCPAGKQVNHLNGNKKDNRFENLEYVTRSENLRHAFLSGLWSPPMRRLTPDAVRAIRAERSAGGLLAAIGAKHGVSRATVGDIISGRRWSTLP